MSLEVPDWGSLGRRIDGAVAVPGSAAYQASGPPFNARFQAWCRSRPSDTFQAADHLTAMSGRHEQTGW